VEGQHEDYEHLRFGLQSQEERDFKRLCPSNGDVMKHVFSDIGDPDDDEVDVTNPCISNRFDRDF